jgi:protein O-GlcNAc transferase
MPSLLDVLDVQFKQLGILDVGAMDEGEGGRFDALADRGAATITGFEPQESEREKLIGQGRPNRRYLPQVLGQGGPATLYECGHPGCTSLYQPDGAVIDRFITIGTEPETGNFRVVGETPVETTRLDDIADLGPVDLLKADIQGAEFDLLSGAERVLGDVLVVECEVEFIPLYAGQPLFHDVSKVLHDAGFFFHKFVDISGRCFHELYNPGDLFSPLSQALWADAIFVRRFTDFETLADDALLKLALVLNDIYHSYDMVAAILAVYDKRHQTTTSGTYIAALQGAPDVSIMFMNIKNKF